MNRITLDEYLQTLIHEERVYIGSATGFFYIGGAQVFYKKQPSLCRKYKKFFQDRIVDYKKRIETCRYFIDANVKQLEDDIETLTMEEIIILRDEIDHMNRSLKRYNARVEYYQYALEHFKPFTERRIKWIHNKNKFDDDIGIAIKIEGCEKGDYWTYNEYTEKNR